MRARRVISIVGSEVLYARRALHAMRCRARRVTLRCAMCMRVADMLERIWLYLCQGWAAAGSIFRRLGLHCATVWRAVHIRVRLAVEHIEYIVFLVWLVRRKRS